MRARLGAPRRHAYGPAPIEGLDIYMTKRPNAPINIFIHGGAWRVGLAKDYAFAAELFVHIAGKAVLIDDQAARATILRDAKHMGDASETAFEFWIDRVMHTRWENVLTPQMRSEHRKWRAPAGPAAPSGPRFLHFGQRGDEGSCVDDRR